MEVLDFFFFLLKNWYLYFMHEVRDKAGLPERGVEMGPELRSRNFLPVFFGLPASC